MNLHPDLVESLTPIVLAVCGTILGIASVFAPGLADSTRASGIGLASACLSGAAGLAKARDRQAGG